MTIFNPILQGGIFTFQVGPEKASFIIHKKVVEDNSAVLARLMNNGAMQESTTGIAQLPDTEADTFALFAEFVYTGFYRVVGQPSSEYSLWFNVLCYECKERHVVPGSRKITPMACLNCHDTHIIAGDIDTQEIVWNVPKDDPARSRKRKRPIEPVYRDVFQLRNTLAFNNGEAAKLFKQRLYPALNRSHGRLVRYLATLSPSDLAAENVSAHARLYVFSQKYMISALKRLCLHKLHRDLIKFSVTPSNIHEIVELLTYTYDNTADDKEEGEENGDTARPSGWRDIIDLANDDSSDIEEDDASDDSNEEEEEADDEDDDDDDDNDSSDENDDTVEVEARAPVVHGDTNNATRNRRTSSSAGDEKELRDLVMSYAVLNAQELMEYSSFTAMLQNGGQLVSDFTKGITKRLRAH